MGVMRGFEGNFLNPRGGAVGCDIALQSEGFRVRFPMVSISFF